MMTIEHKAGKDIISEILLSETYSLDKAQDGREKIQKERRRKPNGKLRFGFIGSGKLVLPAVELFRYSPRFSLNYYSARFVASNYEAQKILDDELIFSKPINYCRNLEQLFGESDIVFVGTALHKEYDYVNAQKEGRGVHQKRMLENNFGSVVSVLEGASRAKFPGVLVFGTNPTSYFQELAMNFYDFRPEQLMGFNNDSVRLKIRIANVVERNYDCSRMNLLKGLDTPVAGTHSSMIWPLWEETTYWGIPLLERFPLLKRKEAQDEITAETREFGPSVMGASTRAEIYYRGVQSCMLRFFKDLAEGRYQPKQCFELFHPEYGFTQWKGEFHQDLNRCLSVHPCKNYNPIIPGEIEKRLLEEREERRVIVEELEEKHEQR